MSRTTVRQMPIFSGPVAIDRRSSPGFQWIGLLSLWACAMLVATAPLKAQITFKQSVFEATHPPTFFLQTYQRKYNRALAFSQFFDGVEIIVLDLDTPEGLADLHNTVDAVRDVGTDTGTDFVGFWTFPRLPGFYHPNVGEPEQPASFRSRGLNSDASFWTKYPALPTDGRSKIPVTGDHLDITNREAVNLLLDNIAVAFDQDGAPETSIGKIPGFITLNEWKLTSTYKSYADLEDNNKDVDSPDRLIRLGPKTQQQLLTDVDPYIGFLNAPMRAMGLYSESAAISFARYAHEQGFDFKTLPASRLEFNDDDASLVELPPWIEFVSYQETDHWKTWVQWVYETWTEFVIEVVREMSIAQAGNSDYRGAILFTNPVWYSILERTKLPIAFSWYETTDTNPDDEVDELQSETVTTVSHPPAEWSRVNAFTSATDVEKFLASPWFAGVIHETTRSLWVRPPAAASLIEADIFVDNSDRFKYWFMAQGALSKDVCETSGKMFGAFARAQYFKDHDHLEPPHFERAFRRTIGPLEPSIVATIGPWFVDQSRLPQELQSSMLGQTGELQDAWVAKQSAYRASFPFKFVEQPWPQRPAPDASATFHVRIGGDHTPTYRWQFSETSPQSGFTNLTDGAEFDGTDTAALEITSARAEHEGWYRCRAVNAGVVRYSSASRLQILQPTYLDAPHRVPGTIQAEDYDDGGPHVAYFDTTPQNLGGAYRVDEVDIAARVNGDPVVGWTAAGEWMEYTVDVEVSGEYDLDVWYAARHAGRRLRFLLDGVDISGEVTLPATGAWHTYEVFTIPDLRLDAGTKRVLRIESVTGGYNLDAFTLRYALPTEVLVSDDFQGGALNTLLAGRSTPVGARVWAGGHAVFGTGGTVTTRTSKNVAVGVPFDPAEVSYRVVGIEADVDPGVGSGWIAIGFTKQTGHGWWNDGQIWLLVRPNGTCRLFADGVKQSLSEPVVIPEFDSNGLNTVQLVYDPLGRRASVIANGELVMNGVAIRDGFIPDIEHAGWGTLSGTRNDRVLDNWQLRVK